QRCRPGVFNHLRVDAAAALEDAEHRHLAGSPTPTFSFARAAEVTLVDLDLAMDRALIFDARGNDLTQTVIEQRRSVLVDANERGRGPAGVPATKCSHSRSVCFSESFECLSRIPPSYGLVFPRAAPK